ncbi:MAG: DNA polymerase III subunit delta [Clostridiales bacterium]|nr:DNA polymerase III subunit delta [Clostridiales bacterium]
MRKTKQNEYEELKTSLKTGSFLPFYIFYGEESYLMEYSISEIRKKLVQPDMESFNLIVLEGSAVTLDNLSDAVLSYPVMAEKKLVILRDFDILKPPAAMQEGIRMLLTELPEYLCLIVCYDTIPFSTGKALPLMDLVKEKAAIVNFQKSGEAELVKWIKRRFSALNKSIETKEAEYLIFISGALMNSLIHEIEKIASFAKNKEITQTDIDAVVTKALEAQVYQMTDSISNGDLNKSFQTLRTLLLMKYDPILLCGAVTRQMLRLYSAKLALKEGRHIDDLMKVWGMKSTYPAEKLFTACRNFSIESLQKGLEYCTIADQELKRTALDKQRVLEMLLIQIAASKEGAK